MDNYVDNSKLFPKIFIAIVLVIGLAIQTLLVIHIFNQGSIEDKAIVTMSSGLLFLWAVMGGTLMLIFKNRIRARFSSSNLYVIKFFIFSVIMCLIAEIISTSMTNTAYLWGLSPYETYITASPNYIEVITKHSIIVFLPQFVCWGIFLSRYNISAHWAVLIYGITGYLNELIAFGLSSNAMSLPYWILIYGLIIYLPAFCLPRNPQRETKFYHYMLFIILPILFTVPWVILLRNTIL